MPITHTLCRMLVTLGIAAPTLLQGQSGLPGEGVGGPITRVPVVDAPFVADATTTVRLTAPGSEQSTHQATLRYYRDPDGRVRIDVVDGGDLLPANARQQSYLLPDAVTRKVFSLDSRARTVADFSNSIAGTIFNGADAFALPTGIARFRVFYKFDNAGSHLDLQNDLTGYEALGTSVIEGLVVEGRRTTTSLPTGGERSYESWWSDELRLLIHSRNIDPRMGVFEYRLTNIRRTIPPRTLFEIPTGYTLRGADTPSTLLELRGPG